MTDAILPIAWAAAIAYLFASALYLLRGKFRAAGKAAVILSFLGCALNAAGIALRAALLKRPPLETGGDFLLLFAFFVVLLYLFYERRTRNKSAGFAACLISALLILFSVVFLGDQLAKARPVIPELKSPLLFTHVITCALAYASFVVGAGLAAVRPKKGGPEETGLWVFRISAFGFVMLTLGILLGAVWAEQAWGSYWSWDPKEIWALITWVIYAIYFHKRKSWSAKTSNIMVILGCALAILTFFGVNFLLSGLHSYA